MKATGTRFLGLFLLTLYWTASGFAGNAVPNCPAYGKNLEVNNQQALHWRRTTPNQFRERAHVKGNVVYIYPDRNGHEHFEIQIGREREDAIEVIYNSDFGALPDVREGMVVEACGDYITSTAQSGPYPPSPAGAIIHWIHMNPKGRGHEPGFLMIDGALYGQDAEHAGPGRGRDQKPNQNQSPRQGGGPR